MHDTLLHQTVANKRDPVVFVHQPGIGNGLYVHCAVKTTVPTLRVDRGSATKLHPKLHEKSCVKTGQSGQVSPR